MQNKKVEENVLLSVPLEMLEEAGIEEESIVQITAREGKVIINKVDNLDNFVCDNKCCDCPLNYERKVY
jgi:bifunctional DNA-binding transcriptional regulator/antitoxin component of YhaV-PrlF toxin-antitoxin module